MSIHPSNTYLNMNDYQKAYRMVIMKISLLTVLSDVIHAQAKDIERLNKYLGKDLKRTTKMKYNEMIKAAKTLKIRASDVSLDAYLTKDVDDFCDDAEALEAIIMAAVQNLGKDNEHLEQIVEFINNIKPKL